MLIKSLQLKNILSFRDATLELRPLNVLIGPNGSGKSNLIDVVALLRSAPDDVAGFLRRNGPTGNWVWQGAEQRAAEFPTIQVGAELRLPEPVRYDLKALTQDDRVHSLSENLNHIEPDTGETDRRRPVFQSANGKSTVWPMRAGGIVPTRDDEAETIDLAAGKSALSAAVSHPVNCPALTVTAQRLAAVKIYRSWYVGRDSAVRRPQCTDGSDDFLEEDFSNLARVVNKLKEQRLKPSMDEYLQRFYEDYESLHVRVYDDSTIQLAVNEKGQSGSLPVTRLSDGTIRFIALLAILCDPNPPPLVCIEEPEIAMHPDSLWLVKELLLAASERTQIIVTTHSTELVSLFSSDPEAVVVCDRDAAEGTRFRRVTRAELNEWQDFYEQTGKELVVYGLSEMWMSGSLGGVR